jgi:hypothetical protein
MQRFAARRQDPQARTVGEKRRADLRSLAQHVLARVENEERVGVSKPGGHPPERVGAADVDGVREESDDVVCAARTREVDEPDAFRELLLQGARGLEREPALPHAGRPGERHDAVLTQKKRHLAELLLTADERRRRRGEVAAAPTHDRGGGDPRVVSENRLLQPAKLRPRLEAELVGEHAPGLLKRLQRIRLTTAAVERQHQLAPQPLPERVVCQCGAERRCELAMFAEREPDLEVLLERVDVQRLQPASLGAEPRRAGQALQRRSAPERQCRRDRVRRGGDVAIAERRARVGEQRLE